MAFAMPEGIGVGSVALGPWEDAGVRDAVAPQALKIIRNSETGIRDFLVRVIALDTRTRPKRLQPDLRYNGKLGRAPPKKDRRALAYST
jgi:hypothetical protein